MANETLRQYLATTEPWRRGKFGADQIALGCHALRGRCPMISGAVVLVRRRLYPATGDWDYCGSAVLAATTIGQAAAPHEAAQAYHYAAAVTLGNGYLSPLSKPVRIEFDDQGDLITPLMPAAPIEPCAKPLASGAFRVCWAYDEWGQGAAPADFAAFEGADAESVDYEAIVATVAYAAGRAAYTCDTGQYEGGSSHVFAVRARNANQVAERNTITTEAAVAQAATPTTAAIVLAMTRQKGL